MALNLLTLRVKTIQQKCVMLALILLPALWVNAVAAPSVRIGIEHFPPYLTINEDGGFGGSELAKLKQALDALKIPYTIRGYPPARQFEYIATGKIDLVITIKKTDNAYAKTALFSRNPILKIVLRMYAMPGTPISLAKESWAGKRFIVIKGYSYGGFIKTINDLEAQHKITVYRISNHLNAFRMLQAGRGHYVIDYKSPSGVVLDQLGLSELSHQTLFDIDVHLVMNRNLPDAETIMKQLEHYYSTTYPESLP